MGKEDPYRARPGQGFFGPGVRAVFIFVVEMDGHMV